MVPFRCATCVFFNQHRPEWLDRPAPRGQCRRFAPVLDRHEDGRLRTVWPMVHEDAYCGEHAEVEDSVDQAPEEPAQPPPRERPTGETGPMWRCVNCKEVTVSWSEPERCGVCRCQQLVKVDED